MNSKKVLFLLSTERSGSTFFIHLMNAHSQVYAPPTSHLIRILWNNIEKYGDLHSNKDILIQDIKAVLNNMLGEWSSSIEDLQLTINGNETTNEVIKTIIEQVYLPSSGNKTNILIKENYSWQFFPFLKNEMGIHQFIHLVRDPRDVALSWKKSPNHPGGIKEAVKRWKEDQEEFLKLNVDDIYLLKYEKLIASSEKTLVDLFKFLNLTFDRDVLHFYHKDSAKTNASRLQNWANIAKPILSDNLGKFNTGLNKDEISYIEFHCQNLMHTLGYEITTDMLFNEQNIVEPQNKLALLTAEEKNIRDNRLAIIQRIISRNLS